MSAEALKKQSSPKENPNPNVRPFGMKDKIGYLLGDFGNDFFFLLVSAYLMVFYTDIFGINAATVGALFMAARLWDAVADVTWGRFIDTRKPTKNGKFRPWVLRMSFPLVFSGVLMFITVPGQSDGFYLAWAFVTYIVWGTLYSTVNIPYGSMASVMTDKPDERTSLSTYRTAGMMLASLIINAVGPMIVFVDNKIDANRMFMAACIFGVLAISCYIGCYKLTTERIVPESNDAEKMDLRKTLKAIGQNKPLIWILTASLLFMTNSMLMGAVNVYLFKDYFTNTAALSLVGVMTTVTSFIAMPLVKPLVARFGKKEIAAVGMGFAAIIYFVLFMLKDISAMTFVWIAAFGMFGTAFLNVVIWAFVTDVIDYHEYLTGLREDATIYSVYSFARKVGQAVAGGLGGFLIAAVGYNAALETQTEGTLNGIHALGTLAPALFYAVIFLILMFLYPLTKKRTEQLAIDIAERRKK